jgi:RNA polymerase sigma-70 factor, ECF subfamily
MGMLSWAENVENVAQFEAHRAALTGHCYRMLGSVVDAEDAVQDTMVRAWRNFDAFDGRSSVKTWLYRIATNVCLDSLGDRKRRARPMEEGPPGTVDAEILQHPRSHWLEPIADSLVLPGDANPSELAILRESIRLAFVAALQHLPAKQRAVLLLVEVLGWSAAEAAASLEISVAAVNSALQRARATLAQRRGQETGPLSESQARLVEQYADAFQRYDLEGLVSLLREDATLSMPPIALWLRGPATIREWMLGRGSGCRGSRLLPTAACGSPAFAQYRPSPDGEFKPWSLIVLELSGDRIVALNSFLDTETLFPRFGFPPQLPA